MQDNSMLESSLGEKTATTSVDTRPGRLGERGAGVVEWLGISALSIGMLVVLFTAMEALGLDVVTQIRVSLGL